MYRKILTAFVCFVGLTAKLSPTSTALYRRGVILGQNHQRFLYPSLPSITLRAMNTLQPSDCTNCSPDERKTQKAPCSNPNEKKGLQEEKVQYNLFYDRSISDYIIREVKPYLIVYDTFAKGRWLGRKLIDILSVEYGGFPIEYWQNGIKRGFVKVNNANVTEDYIVKNADRIYHKAHRHEPMVYGEIQFVGETESLLAVSKPASIPMHPCGNYRHNSLEMILKNEPIVPNQPNLYIVHRLDR